MHSTAEDDGGREMQIQIIPPAEETQPKTKQLNPRTDTDRQQVAM